MIEREIKVRVEDLGRVRERLARLGGTCRHERSRERNTLYDRDGDLTRTGCVLRVREDGRGVRVTFKGPATFNGRVKSRTELETAVGDAAALDGILIALGYVPSLRYEKEREEWAIDSSLVALDHTPLGDFVEVEGPDPESLLVRLDLGDLEPESLSYPGLWERARLDDPTLGEHMLFDADASELG